MVFISVSPPLCDGKTSAGAYRSQDAPVIWAQIADILDVQLHIGGVPGVQRAVLRVFAGVRTVRWDFLEGSRKSELAPLVIGGRDLGAADVGACCRAASSTTIHPQHLRTSPTSPAHIPVASFSLSHLHRDSY
jgi:hypothetical protein